MSKSKPKMPQAREPLLLNGVSWGLTLLLGAGLFYILTLLTPPGDSHPTLHVASRYLESGTKETGFSNLIVAVFLDYRSFDLLLLGALLLTAELTVFLFYFSEEKPIQPWLRGSVLFCVFGVILIVLVGLVCVWGGSNFLDYEFFGSWFDSPQSRIKGAELAGLGLGLTVAGFLFLFWKTLLRWKEDYFDV
jgi:hypothetical protein